MARANSAWGLDVGVTSLKAVKLRREGGGVTVEAFDVVEHDRFLTEPDVDRDDVIRHTLQKFLERHALKHETVFVGVPGSSTFARFVKLPPVEARKIPEIVRFEAIQQIPFPLEQVNWDYQTFTQPDSPEVEVGIFAMKKELVAHVMSNFQNSALRVEGVQMSPLAVFNAVTYDEMTEGKGTIVLDIGAEHTDLIFIDGGRVWLRTINIGGNNFTDSLSKSFKVSFAKAEQLKRTAATSKYAKQIFQAMRPVFADLVAEIQRSKGYYDSSHRDSKLDRIIGMGNPFKLPNLQKYIQQEMKMEVVRLENLKKIEVDAKLAPGLHEHILALGGALGLALQGLDIATIDTNLLPMEIARQMLWRQKQPMFAAAAALIAVGVGFGAFTLVRQSQTFNEAKSSQEAVDLQSEIGTYERFNSEYMSVPDTAYNDTKTQIEALNMGVGGSLRNIWPQVYYDLLTALPQKPSESVSDKRLVIRSINSLYTNNILNATVSENDAGSSPMAAPPMGAMMPPGMSRPPGMGMGMGMPSMGGSRMSINSTPGGSGDLRGFVLQIKGYTPYRGLNTPEDNGRKLILAYVDKLLSTAPEKVENGKTPKPYYFLTSDSKNPTGTIQTITYTPPNAGNTANNRPLWGDTAAKGPFLAAFSSEILGISGDGGGGGGGAMPPFGGGGGGGGDLTSKASAPIDPDTKRILSSYDTFNIPLRLVIRNPAK